MKEQFCNYVISLRLKNLGFDEPCLAWNNLNTLSGFGYWKQEKNIWRNSELHTGYITAPLFQQAIDWLREKHNLFVDVEFFKLKETDEDEDIEIWEYKINKKWTIGNDWYEFKYGFKHLIIERGFYSYKEAREQAILKAIEILELPKDYEED